MRSSYLSAVVALAVIMMPAGASAAASPPVAVSSAVDPVALHVAEAARRFGIPEAWIWAVMRVESGGDPRVVSPAGAMGLLQIMPATWATMRTRYGLGDDPYEPRANIMAGTAFLREMLDRYGAPGFLAAYNAGPGRYDDYLSGGRPLPPETVAYLTKLAPIIGGAAPQTLTVAASDPLAWTRSALFVRTASTSAGSSSEPSPDAVSADSAAVAAPSDMLFVRRAIPTRPQ